MTQEDFLKHLSSLEHNDLYYGENPYQIPATHYLFDTNDLLALQRFNQRLGKPVGYNNDLDFNSAIETIVRIAATFDVSTGQVPFIAVGLKHGNPCGAAVSDDPDLALSRMVLGDPIALYGGVVITNFMIDERRAEVLRGKGTSLTRGLAVVIAPEVTNAACEVLERKKGDCRVLENGHLQSGLDRHSLSRELQFRSVRGGFLVQPSPLFVLDIADERLQKSAELTAIQIRDILLAVPLCHCSASNAVTLVNDGRLIGNGVGQPDRVGASKVACELAERGGHSIVGSVGASDNYFPFSDGPRLLAEAGVAAIFTTTGSIRDAAVKEACLDAGMVLWTLPDEIARGFRH